MSWVSQGWEVYSQKVFIDVNIKDVDTKAPTHYDLAARVLGWTEPTDCGITIQEFETFCRRCKHCKRYSSSHSIRTHHVCPADSGSANQGLELSPPLSSAQVQALYDQFHTIHDSSGIILEELEHLFVICWKCDRIMVRTAALGHEDATGHESSPIPQQLTEML